MRSVLLDSGAPPELHPLTCTRSLADCTVGGITFRNAQLDRLTAADFTAFVEPRRGNRNGRGAMKATERRSDEATERRRDEGTEIAED